eukprot:5017217-Karenia_brevis.AAC.1
MEVREDMQRKLRAEHAVTESVKEKLHVGSLKSLTVAEKSAEEVPLGAWMLSGWVQVEPNLVILGECWGYVGTVWVYVGTF